jgi:eukaryotic-like serine/threonine-protein kinase
MGSDRAGKPLGTFGQPDAYRVPAISPNGNYVALEVFSSPGTHIEIFELARGIATRFTFDPELTFDPLWSPDGARLLYAGQLSESSVWFVKNADRSGQEELVFMPRKFVTPHSWSPDGKYLLGSDALPPADIYAVDISTGSPKDRKLIPVVSSTQSNDVHPRFSPDGNWFAYNSNESGSAEIYVRPWDSKAGRLGSGGLTVLSKGGARDGNLPIWGHDGKQLYYLSAEGTMMAVDVTLGATFSAGTPRPLFKIDAPNVIFFDVTADGQRFLMPLPDKPVAMMAPFNVVVNWTSTLKK